MFFVSIAAMIKINSTKNCMMEEFLGVTARRTGVYILVHEDSRTGRTTKLPIREIFA